jgi:hypothetical protein
MLGAHVEDELLDLALFDLDRREAVGGRVLEFALLDLSGGYVLPAFAQSLGCASRRAQG